MVRSLTVFRRARFWSMVPVRRVSTRSYLRDRQHLAEDGFVVVVAALNRARRANWFPARRFCRAASSTWTTAKS